MLQLIIYTLLLPEGQKGEAWEKYFHFKKKDCDFQPALPLTAM